LGNFTAGHGAGQKDGTASDQDTKELVRNRSSSNCGKHCKPYTAGVIRPLETCLDTVLGVRLFRFGFTAFAARARPNPRGACSSWHGKVARPRAEDQTLPFNA